MLGLATACSAPSTPAANTPTPRPEIKSTDFVLIPCGPAEADKPCALLMAGGKRVLFGAPAGVTDTLTDEDLANLDALMLFSLNGRDIEGLDEVRNESWLAGRDAPLPVSGPEGTEDVIAALNLAYEQSDALAFVEQGAKGGFDAAVLAMGGGTFRDEFVGGVMEVKSAFDTGDLTIRGIMRDGDNVHYSIHYNRHWTAHLQPCGIDNTVYLEADQPANEQRRIACDGVGSDAHWPLTTPLFILPRGEKTQADYFRETIE